MKATKSNLTKAENNINGIIDIIFCLNFSPESGDKLLKQLEEAKTAIRCIKNALKN